LGKGKNSQFLLVSLYILPRRHRGKKKESSGRKKGKMGKIRDHKLDFKLFKYPSFDDNNKTRGKKKKRGKGRNASRRKGRKRRGFHPLQLLHPRQPIDIAKGNQWKKKGGEEGPGTLQKKKGEIKRVALRFSENYTTSITKQIEKEGKRKGGRKETGKEEKKKEGGGEKKRIDGISR